MMFCTHPCSSRCRLQSETLLLPSFYVSFADWCRFTSLRWIARVLWSRWLFGTAPIQWHSSATDYEATMMDSHHILKYSFLVDKWRRLISRKKLYRSLHQTKKLSNKLFSEKMLFTKVNWCEWHRLKFVDKYGTYLPFFNPL